MKKLAALVALLLLAPLARAQTSTRNPDNSFTVTLTNEVGLAYSRAYVVDMAGVNSDRAAGVEAAGAGRISAEVVYGSATFAPATFTNTGYALNTGQITVANHGLTLALPVLYSRGTSLAIGGLTGETTYYAIPVDANTLELASSSALAQAGTYLTLTSSAATASNYTLKPLAITGTPGLEWQLSNDGANWLTLRPAVSSVTVSSYSSPPAAAAWDLGVYNYRFVRLNVTAPTTGGLSLVTTLNTKR